MTLVVGNKIYSDAQRVQRAEQAVNYIFDKLKAFKSGWRASFETQADMDAAKQEWLAALMAHQIMPDMVERALLICRDKPSVFFPAIGEFISWCHADHDAEYLALGLPTEEQVLSRFRSYMGFHKHDAASFPYRSKAEYWLFRKAYERYACSEDKSLHSGLIKILKEAADKVKSGFDFPDIPKFIAPQEFKYDSVRVENGIAKCRAALGRS